MRPPQGAEWLVILLLILLLFGAKRLPDVARGLGRSMRILKAETKGLHDEEGADKPVAASAPPPPAVTSSAAVAEEVARPADPTTAPSA